MSLNAKVAKFLRNPASFSGITFRFFGREVSPQIFEAVADRMDSNPPKINVVQGQKEDVASYDPKTNTMSLPRAIKNKTNTIEFGGLIVHEAVHAYADIQGKPVLEAADEGAAYIAQALFLWKHKQAGHKSLPPAVWKMAAQVLEGASLTKGDGRAITKRFLRFLRSVKDQSGKPYYNITLVRNYYDGV